nr:hypothetical protein [uncultured Mucilaginibacter sp.]
MKQILAIVALLIACANPIFAQHEHHNTDTSKTSQHTDEGPPMTSKFSLDLPMNRDGSGTSWVPDETPIYAYMLHGKKWMTMIHGDFFLRYNKQDVFNAGTRGGSKVDAPNMVMLMSQRRVGRNGLFSINTMFSLDPFLVGSGGYPLLYQTGESYKGNILVDRQHPHDLFAQLSLAYTHRVASHTDLSLSVGYPSEPALGPPVFMHRLSGWNTPDAPLSHHYQDATHIAFGVATLGLRHKNFKLEGSVFTGREPDEFRYGFDKARFDSYSVRLSYNPSSQWAFQVSNGWLRNPEEAHPENVNRFTASAIHTKMLSSSSYVATTLVYGQNKHAGHGEAEPSVLLESTMQWSKTALYGRYEFVQKDAEALDLESALPTNPKLNINAITLGTNYILGAFKQTNITAGVQGTLNISPGPVKYIYGSAPVAIQVYLRVNPSMLKLGRPRKMIMDMDM